MVLQVWIDGETHSYMYVCTLIIDDMSNKLFVTVTRTTHALINTIVVIETHTNAMITIVLLTIICCNSGASCL